MDKPKPYSPPICPSCNQVNNDPMQSYCKPCRAAYHRARRHLLRQQQPPPPTPQHPTRTCDACNASLPAPAFPPSSHTCRNCTAIRQAQPPAPAGRPPLPIDPITQAFIDRLSAKRDPA